MDRVGMGAGGTRIAVPGPGSKTLSHALRAFTTLLTLPRGVQGMEIVSSNTGNCCHTLVYIVSQKKNVIKLA